MGIKEFQAQDWVHDLERRLLTRAGINHLLTLNEQRISTYYIDMRTANITPVYEVREGTSYDVSHTVQDQVLRYLTLIEGVQLKSILAYRDALVLDRALRALSEEQRQFIHLKYDVGLTNPAIVDKLKLSNFLKTYASVMEELARLLKIKIILAK